jgi:hypothetical protein
VYARKVEVPRIRSICQDIHWSNPVLRLVSDCSYQEAAATISDEIRDLRALRADTAPITKTYLMTLEPTFSACELATVQLTDLFAFCVQHKGDEKSLLWPGKQGTNGTFVLETLADNLASTLLGIRHLVIVGLDGQARVLLRWFVELADVLVAISFDRALFQHYVRHVENPDESRDNWDRHLKPSKVRKVLRRLDHLSASRSRWASSAHEFTEPITVHEYVSMVHGFREDTYRWLSLYSHADFLAQAISSIPFPAIEDKAKVLGRNDRLGHLIDKKSKHTLYRTALYSWMSWLSLFWLLRRKHDWNRLAAVNERFGWFCYRSEVLSQYMRIHYDEITTMAYEDDDSAKECP